MSVSENKKINVGLRQKRFVRERQKPFVWFAEKRSFYWGGLRLAAFSRKKVHRADAQIRMQTREKPLIYRIGENALDEFVPIIGGTQTVAVTDEKPFAANVADYRLTINRNAKIVLEELKNPHIVVSCQKKNRQTAVAQLSEFTQKPMKPFGNDCFILKKIIEYIAD